MNCWVTRYFILRFEAQLTNFTFERSFSCMNSEMNLQHWWCWKGFLAYGTSVRFSLFRFDVHVCLGWIICGQDLQHKLKGFQFLVIYCYTVLQYGNYLEIVLKAFPVFVVTALDQHKNISRMCEKKVMGINTPAVAADAKACFVLVVRRWLTEDFLRMNQWGKRPRC